MDRLQLDLSFRRGVKSAAFDEVHVYRSCMRELKFLPGNTQGSMRVSALNAGELTDFSTAQEIPEKMSRLEKHKLKRNSVQEIRNLKIEK